MVFVTKIKVDICRKSAKIGFCFKVKAMLIEFRVKNFRSIKDDQVLSFNASSSREHEECVHKLGKFRILKALSVYGPNASGKSNLIKSLDFMRSTILNSASLKPLDSMPSTSFRFDEESRTQPSEFEVSFFLNGVRHQYGFSIYKAEIMEEWLYVYPLGRPQKWFLRKRESNSEKSQYDFGTHLKGDKVGIQEKTRENALFLSVATRWNNEQLAQIYDWFKESLIIINPGSNLYQQTARMLYESHEDNELNRVSEDTVTQFLKSADLGVDGIKVKELSSDQVQFPEEMPESIREKLKKELTENPPLVVELQHKVSNDKNVSLSLQDESDGTQRLFELFGPIMASLSESKVMIIDEFENHLHPLITRKLLRLFLTYNDKESYPQLFFSTHDTTLLDPELLRRDQVYFTEKNNAGETNLYSLAEYKKVRKGEPYQKGYLSGRYGAIPIIESFEIK